MIGRASPPARDHTSARGAVLAAALLFSTGGAAIKATALDGWTVAGLRSGIAVVAFLALLPAARRAWSLRTLAVGLAYGVTLVSFVLANKLTTSANVIFLQSTGPLYIVILAPWLLGERIRRADVWFMSTLAVGLALFFVTTTPAQASAPQPLLGNVIAAASGFTWALTVIGLRWLARAHESGHAALGATTLGNLMVFAVCAGRGLDVSALQSTDVFVVVYLGVFQLGLSYVLLTSAIRHVPAVEASLLLLVEPAFNPVWAWLVHGERPGAWALAGGAIILSATAAKALLDARAARRLIPSGRVESPGTPRR